MKMFKFSQASVIILTALFAIGLTGPLAAYAATTPSLGTASTFGLISNLFQHNATTTITGVAGNGLGVLGHSSTAGAGIVNVVNGIELPNSDAAWTVAGIAQGVAQTNLNNQYLNSCTDISSLTPAALEGVVINGGAPGTFPPGCYWSSGAMGITASGIVTLSGAGTHLFRPGGALTTGANSHVNLSGAGASACDVFWIPIAATNLGANSIFTGTDIDASGITIGDTVAWSGRALAYGGTVTSNGGVGAINTITVPTCTNPASLTITKTVINDNGGTKVVADFPLFVGATLVTSGVLNNFAPGAYVVSETTDPYNYVQTFSASCTGGNITLAADGTYACTITNNDIAPQASMGGQSRGSGGSVVMVSPLIHVTKVPNPLSLSAGGGAVTYTERVTNPGTVALSNVSLVDNKCSPMAYISGDTNSDSKLDTTETWTYTCRTNLTQTTTNTATAEGMANGTTVRDSAIATVVVASPKLPNTGLPPREQNTQNNIVVLIGLIAMVSVSFVIVSRNRTV